MKFNFFVGYFLRGKRSYIWRRLSRQRQYNLNDRKRPINYQETTNKLSETLKGQVLISQLMNIFTGQVEERKPNYKLFKI